MIRIELIFNPTTGEFEVKGPGDAGVILAMLERARNAVVNQVLAPKPAIQSPSPELAAKLLNGR